MCYLHGELRLVLADLSTPTSVCTPSLARLRASRAEEKRVGARLTGWHQSPGEQGDGGRQRETSAYSIRKAPGGDSTWNQREWVGDATPAHRTSKFKHMHTQASKHVITQSQKYTRTNTSNKDCARSWTARSAAHLHVGRHCLCVWRYCSSWSI